MTADRSRRPGPSAACTKISAQAGPIGNVFLIARYDAAPGHPEG